MFRRLVSLLRVGRRDPAIIALAIQAYLALIVARGYITLLPLRRITGRLGEPMVETPREYVDAEAREYARRVAWSIRKLSPHTPTESNCYPQALAARWLLHRRGIPTTFYYGAAFERDRPALATHVWLRCGPLIVTGGRTGRRYRALTYYADHGHGAPVESGSADGATASA